MKQINRILKKQHVIISIIALLLLVSGVIVIELYISQRLQYLQHAAGNIITANPGDNLTQKVNSLSPGDTLVLNDGIYANSQLLVQDKHGTQTAHIAIIAAHDGKAIIDGGANQNYPDVILVDNSTYIDIQGLVARNSAFGVVAVVNPSSFITIKRVTAYNAGMGNVHIFSTEPWGSGDPSNVLFEDDAGWGNGRYIYSAYHATNITFRRCYAYWTSQSNFSPAPRAPFNVYGASNVLLENDIGIHGIPDQNSTDYFVSDWQTTDGPPQDNATYLGVMFFDNWEGLWVNGSAGNNTIIKNSYFENTRKQGSFTTNRNHGDAIMWGTNSGVGGNVDTSTIVNNEVGFSKQSSQNPTLSDSVFLNNDTAITGGQKHTYTDFFGNGVLGTTIGQTDKQVDPGYNVAKYGKGAYLFIPDSSPLKHAGLNGSDIGANILYEYVNGQLTNQPLWPWPMESRILSEKGTSVTWASNGGFWNTLDGVYPNTSMTPPLVTPTDTPTLPITSTYTPTVSISPSPNLTPTQTQTSPTPTPTAFPSGITFCEVHCVTNADCDASGLTCGTCDPNAHVCMNSVPTSPTTSISPTSTDITPILSPTVSLPTTTVIPTVSVTATPTLGPAIGTLSVHFDGIDKQNNGNPNHPQRQLVLSFYKNQNFTVAPNAIFTIPVTYSWTDQNGLFNNNTIDLSTLPQGNYFVLAKSSEGSLRELLSTQPIFIAKGITTSLNGSAPNSYTMLRMGDFNNDNVITLVDYNIFVDCYGKKSQSPICKKHLISDNYINNFADINDDGIVDGVDYNLLIRNFGDMGY